MNIVHLMMNPMNDIIAHQIIKHLFINLKRDIYQLITCVKNPIFKVYLYLVRKLGIKTKLNWDAETSDYHQWYVSEYIFPKLIQRYLWIYEASKIRLVHHIRASFFFVNIYFQSTRYLIAMQYAHNRSLFCNNLICNE